MMGPAPHTADDIYSMYLKLNQAIWEWARRTGKCMLGTLDTHIISMMHQYAYTVRDYLMGCGIPATYSEGWGAKSLDNRIHLSSNGTWWRVHRYYLEVSVLEPGTTDIWVGLNSKHAVWGDADSLYEACCTVDEVVSAVHRFMGWVEAQAQCSGCYYSEGGDYMDGEGVQYCGLGRELLPQCKDYIARGQL
jgi:hypothetical protein